MPQSARCISFVSIYVQTAITAFAIVKSLRRRRRNRQKLIVQYFLAPIIIVPRQQQQQQKSPPNINLKHLTVTLILLNSYIRNKYSHIANTKLQFNEILILKLTTVIRI